MPLVHLPDSFSWKWLPPLWHPVSSLTLGQGSLLVVALSPVTFGAWEIIGGAHSVLLAGPGSYFLSHQVSVPTDTC